MIILLDTSASTAYLTLLANGQEANYELAANRTLARDLLAFLCDKLAEHQATFDDVRAIGVMSGPGSFTGLRIGLTVMNTLADGLGVPIVGQSGENWKADSLRRIELGENDRIVMPEYGAEAHITKPKK